MLIYFNPDSKTIYGINNTLTKEDARKYLNSGCIWVESEEIPDLSDSQEWYLTEDNEVGVRESEGQTPQPTQLDRIEAAVAKSNEEIANAAIDAYTMELIEGGVL